MRQQSLRNFSAPMSVSPGFPHNTPAPAAVTGMVSELVYHHNDVVLTHILLPLLRQFAGEPRWLLWLAPQMKLDRRWLAGNHLPADKVMQLSHFTAINSVDAMEKALRSGNYSVVLGWLPPLTEQENTRLQLAAQQGNCLGFIMRPEAPRTENSVTARQQNRVQIHSFAYH